jgi:polysaccharide biosynthesis transport protein
MAVTEPDLELDVLALVKRRKKLALVVILVVASVAAAVAVFWPPVYRSQATILIEEPDVPSELVKSTVSTFANERLQVIHQRVMTTQNLIRVINKFNLYAEARKRKPITVVVEEMRESITFEVVSADLSKPKNGAAPGAAIAFTIAFDNASPRISQQIANELVTLFLSENLSTRKEQAAGTTVFLSAEAQKLAARIRELENRLAAFKTQHAGAMPEQLAANSQIIDRAQSEVMNVRQQLQSADQRRLLLQGQLAQLSPYDTRSAGTQGPLSPAERLKQLQTLYLSLTSRYDLGHPDVIKAKREIDALEKVVTVGVKGGDLNRQLDRLRTDLEVARRRYGEQHPEIRKLEREIVTVQAAVASRPPTTEAKTSPDNPAYIQVRAQINAVESDIAALKAYDAELVAKINDLEKRILQTPEIERIYVDLRREYEEAQRKYKEIRDKQADAQLAESLEAESKSERFSVIEPPALPERPIKPNRPIILLAGFAFAVAAGAGSGALVDLLDGRVHGSRALAGMMGQAPLAVVPRISNRRERRKVWRKRMISTLAIVAAVAAVISYVHLQVAPLDVVMTVLANRFGLNG